VDGPLVLYIALLVGGMWLLVSNVRAFWEFWRFTPPSKEWDRRGTYGAMGAVTIGALGMSILGLIGLLN